MTNLPLLLDHDGYPTEEALQMIRDWPIEKGWGDLVQLVMKLWKWPDWAKLYDRKEHYVLRLATGGWSGNENIVEALNNSAFGAMCWELSAAGGLHVYKIPKQWWEGKEEVDDGL